ncbi:MAG: serpin family protein [Anaerolineae bacterium]|nr:serpin family protein [Anaerolineae bacterium]
MNPLEQVVQEKQDVNLSALVHGNTDFALALYQKLRGVEGNLFFSPYSISTALAMTYAGARGSTGAQMAQVLHFGLDQEPLHAAFATLEARLAEVGRQGQVQLKVANALWPYTGYTLLAPFVGLVLRYYGVEITAVDYYDPEAARLKINAWAEEKTERKIRELIPPGIIDELTRLVLTNAIYFKGSWASQFDPALTRDAPFSVTSERQVQVSMMTKKAEFGYREVDGLQVLELPYAGDDLSMVVLLPGEIDGLADVEARLTQENLERWTRDLWAVEVQAWLPRFEITCPIELSEALHSMGMVDAFDADDFAGMVGADSLHIQAVLHKAFVAVNEEGTEAAAATAVVMGLRCVPPPPPLFRADHPFLFLIREKRTGSILFLGRVIKPV